MNLKSYLIIYLNQKKFIEIDTKIKSKLKYNYI